MKKNLKLLITTIFVLLPTIANCQNGGVYNNGAKIVVQSGANIVINGDYKSERSNASDGAIDLNGTIKINHDFINNSQSNAFFNLGTDGEIIFNGALPQTISGSYNQISVFEKLTVKNGSFLILAVPISILGTTTLEGTNPSIQIGTYDLTLNNNLSGSGLVKAISTGGLIMTAYQNIDKIFPMSDGVNNYSATVNCNQTTELKVKMINGQNALTGYIWDISHIDLVPVDFNATLKMRIDKAALNSNILPNVFWIKKNYCRLPYCQSTNTDNTTYYEITSTDIHSF